ncbi:hypothetical protein [Methylobacterium sp. J-090]|uniref:hypothetical protein n=1 Tax=Methylobacterium sp. J-090 TaxID=2836666 RepID=UPI001FB9ADF1|nr:hypothetical protein [Methylobacterium sp. J-090]MCJ2084180.1 hypothetical protein [Methylobacterium sp. J-090]
MPVPSHAQAQSKETTGRYSSPDNEHDSTKARDLASLISADNLINPTELLEMAQREPLRATLECQKGLSVLEIGYQEQRRRYIAAAYASAFYIAQDEAALSEFQSILLTQRVIRKSDIDKTRERLIYRIFELVFAKTGRSSSNTAYRYAYGLEDALVSRVSPTEMASAILKLGPEKLYMEALRRSRGERDFAEMLHQRHLDRLKSDGRYACQILGISAENTTKFSHDEKVIPTQQLRKMEAEEVGTSILDDEDDDDQSFPSWRRRVIDTRFEKITLLASQLSAEIVESKKILDDDPMDQDNEGGILRDLHEDTNEIWNDSEIELKYNRLIQKAVELANSSTLLKSMLQERVK